MNLLLKRASDKPETGACKNGPGVEPQFRPSEKTVFYSGRPSYDGERSLKALKPQPRTLEGLTPPPQEKPLRSLWRTGTRRTASRLFPRKHVPPQKKTRPASRMSNPTLLLYPSSPFGLSCIPSLNLYPDV